MTLAAGGYAMATVGMKMASNAPSLFALACIAAGLLGAAFSEIVLFRHSDLAVIYIGVIGAESLLVLAYAAFLGGALNLPQIFGAIFVIAGFSLVVLGE
ncbi:5-aminolevulinate synthase [Sulfitobacter sp. LCG007]